MTEEEKSDSGRTAGKEERRVEMASPVLLSHDFPRKHDHHRHHKHNTKPIIRVNQNRIQLHKQRK